MTDWECTQLEAYYCGKVYPDYPKKGMSCKTLPVAKLGDIQHEIDDPGEQQGRAYYDIHTGTDANGNTRRYPCAKCRGLNDVGNHHLPECKDITTNLPKAVCTAASLLIPCTPEQYRDAAGASEKQMIWLSKHT